MNCLKCGNKTKGDQVFCSHCLEVMETYPVKPDVHVQIPSRRTLPAPKKSWRRRKNLTLEEQIELLRRRVHRLTALTALLAILLGVTAAMLFHTVNNNGELELDLGKNYTVESTTD